jgi:hypothetical protein
VPSRLDAAELHETTADPPTRSRPVRAVHPTVLSAFEALEGAGVRWCLLRGEGELAAPKDVDLLVAPADMTRAREALKSVGFARLRAWGRRPHHFFVSDDETRTRVKLDLVTELAYGRHHELRADGAEGFLARRRYVDEVAVLAPNDAFWTLLLHCMLDRRSFPAEHRRRLLELAGAADARSDMVAVVERVFAGLASARVLVGLVRTAEWPVLTAISGDAYVGWPARQRLRMRLVALANRALRAAARRIRLSRWPV